MTLRRNALFMVLSSATACAPDAAPKLDAMGLQPASREALTRLRFQRLHSGDRLERDDLVLCGPGDRVRIGFSHHLVVSYLGRDADWLLPEIFGDPPADDLILDVSEGQLLRLTLPRGIGADAPHPPGFVRAVDGTPLWSADARAVAQLFEADGVDELFARAATAPIPAAAAPATPSTTAPPVDTGEPWQLGVSVLPRMGPRSAGVVVAKVVPDSHAERAGLARGDRILAIDGRQVSSLRELKTALSSSRGAILRLTIKLKGSSQPSSVTLER